MKHSACTLAIIIFCPGLHAKFSGFIDSIPYSTAKFKNSDNVWLNPFLGISTATSSRKNWTIFCNFRNLPTQDFLSISEFNVNASVTLFQQDKPNFNSTHFKKQSVTRLNTQHRFVSFLDQILQEHSACIQVPFSNKSSISTGLGFIHTYQYASEKTIPILGKIQFNNKLSPSITLVTNFYGIYQDLDHYRTGTLTQNSFPYGLSTLQATSYSSLLSISQTSAIHWHYPNQKFTWNIESALALNDKTIKLPFCIVAATGNTQKFISITGWLPLNGNTLEHLEIGIRTGSNPISMAVQGKSKFQFPKNSFQYIHWSAGIGWSQHLPACPYFSFLFSP